MKAKKSLSVDYVSNAPTQRAKVDQPGENEMIKEEIKKMLRVSLMLEKREIPEVIP